MKNTKICIRDKFVINLPIPKEVRLNQIQSFPLKPTYLTKISSNSNNIVSNAAGRSRSTRIFPFPFLIVSSSNIIIYS